MAKDNNWLPELLELLERRGRLVRLNQKLVQKLVQLNRLQVEMKRRIALLKLALWLGAGLGLGLLGLGLWITLLGQKLLGLGLGLLVMWLTRLGEDRFMVQLDRLQVQVHQELLTLGGKETLNRISKQRTSLLTGKLSHILPEEWRGEVEAVRQRLINAGSPSWFIKFTTAKCLLELLWATVEIYLDNFWLAVRKEADKYSLRR